MSTALKSLDKGQLIEILGIQACAFAILADAFSNQMDRPVDDVKQVFMDQGARLWRGGGLDEIAYYLKPPA